MNTQGITEIEAIKHGGRRFSWGRIVAYHSIGEYDIIEYHPWVYDGPIGTNKINEAKVEFCCYIGGKAIGLSMSNLDSALATCIAYKYDGRNSQAALFFMKMIGKEEK